MAEENKVHTRFTFEVDEKPLNAMKEAFASIKEGLFGLTATLVESGLSIYETVVKTAESGEQLIKLAQSSGIGIGALQGLQAAAKMSGVSTDDLNQSLKFLNRNMYATAAGGPGAANVFGKLGVNIRNTNGTLRASNEVFGDLADKFKAMPDGAEKAGLAMKIFGRNGQTIIPTLNLGSAGMKQWADDAAAFGSILSEQDAKKGEEFMHSLNRVGMAMQGIRNTVASELMPVFTEIIGDVLSWVKANSKLIKSGLKEFLQATVSFLVAGAKVALQFGKALMGFVDIVGGVGNATKILLVTVGLLSAGSILYGIGMLVKAFEAWVAVTELADAATLLIPIGIGLAIAAFGLLYEDLYQYWTGGDSVFGRMMAVTQPFFDAIMDGILKAWNGFKIFGGIILEFLLAPLQIGIDLIGKMLGLISKIPGLGSLQTAGDYASAFANTALNPATSSATSGLYQDGSFNKMRAQGSGYGQPGAGMQVHAPITVNVPTGTPPGAVGDAVQRGVADGVDTHLRNAQRATSSGVEY